MSDAVTHTYRNIVITYNEHPDNWTYTLRGKERVAPTLKEAKATIDKPVAEKQDRFDRFEAFTNDYSYDALNPCVVTSEIEGRYYSGAKIGSDKYRITVTKKNGEKENKQVYASRIYPRTPENCRIKAATDALQVEIDALVTRKNAELKQLTTLEDENQAKSDAAEAKKAEVKSNA
jgi:hypothetical protein